MDSPKSRGLIISDFNTEALSGLLKNSPQLPAIEAEVIPFGQVLPVLLERGHPCWQKEYDFILIWTQPDAVINAFQELTHFQPVTQETILSEVDEFAQAILNITGHTRQILIPTWTFPTFSRGLGILDVKSRRGIANTLMRMNLRLAETFEEVQNVHLLNAQKWIESTGKNSFNPKFWFLSKVPYDLQIFREAVDEIKASLQTIRGESKKMIIVDLDNTLWGGTVGEIGWESLILGGHDPIGEALVDFQKGLKALANSGIILGIASKNEESSALEAIQNHPEMVLRLTDFAGWRINWNDKAQNIVDLTQELNLGLQSVLFIDDNPAERARVKEALPEVLVPDWPEDKMLYKKTLMGLKCFDSPALTAEDGRRTQMYQQEHQRQAMRSRIGSLEDWLKTLNLRITVEKLSEANLQRVTQLLNKTNQMNLSTRRMTENELWEWTNSKHRKLWTFRVADKFGDSGLTGLASLEINGKIGTIVDFILSCRVFGRKIEEAMLHTVLEHARAQQLDEVRARYIQTAKNKPCLDYLNTSPLRYDPHQDLYIGKAEQSFALPDLLRAAMGNLKETET